MRIPQDSRRLALAALLGTVSCGCTGSDDEAPVQPTTPEQLADGWEVGTPESVGMEGGRLDALTAAIEAGEWGNFHALLIARNGRLVHEAYFAGEDERIGEPLGRVAVDRDTLHDIRSSPRPSPAP